MSTTNTNTKPDQFTASATERVLAIVRTKTTSPVSLDSTFDALGLDSLAMAEVIFEIENALGIRTDDRILDVRTMRQVVELVVSIQREAKSHR